MPYSRKGKQRTWEPKITCLS